MEEELRLHVALRMEENIKAGMQPGEARYAALKQFGWTESIKEQCRDQRGISWLDAFIQELHFATRRLIKERGFTSVALATLALCIGSNVIIFAFVDGLLLRPLPFPDSERLVCMQHSYPGAGVERIGASMPNYYDWKKGIPAFASISAIESGTVVVGNGISPVRVLSERVSSEFFETLGIKPARSQLFSENQMPPPGAKVVVVTDDYWKSQFNADPNVIGHSIRIDGQINTVTAVLPPGFRYLSSHAQLYFPMDPSLADRRPNQRHSDNIQIVARLAPGVSIGTAQSQIDAFDARQLEDDPYANELKAAGANTKVYSLHSNHVRSIRSILLTLQAGAVVLLLVGGVNLMNLLLVRATGRSREYAVRQALGASQMRLACEAAIETSLLAIAGGALGLGFAAFCMRAMALMPSSALLGTGPGMDIRTAAAGVLASALLGGVLAIPVTWFNQRNRMADGLKMESRAGTAGTVVLRLRHAFVVAQITLALVLLTGAGLLGMSLHRVLSVSPGFKPQQILTAQLGLPPTKYRDDAARQAFMDRLLDELRGHPGIAFAALSTSSPFIPTEGNRKVISVEGYVPPPGSSIRGHYNFAIAGDYCQTLGIPLLEGRYFETSDYHANKRNCVVDEAFAKRYWPQGGALGHRITWDAKFNESDAFTIVGVVGEIKQNDLADTSSLGTLYRPFRGEKTQSLHTLIRSELPPASLSLALQEAVHRIDPELPVDDIKALQKRIDESLDQRRTPTILASLFAIASLLLVAVGTYGVLAYAITQRRREIGVRMALGALPSHVIFQFLSVGIKFLAIGLPLGLFISWAVGRAMKSLLFQVGSIDATVSLLAIVAMALVVLIAVLIPSRRAALLDPMALLRHE
ncbi:MAG: macB 8 [Verrucomicrobiales bacterium]|nr:macB 8 [Verrucomicrobiales bacterium]